MWREGTADIAVNRREKLAWRGGNYWREPARGGGPTVGVLSVIVEGTRWLP